MYTAAIFLPLLGAVVAGLFGRLIGERLSEIVATGLLFLSAILGAIILFQIGFLYTGLLSIVQQFAGDGVVLKTQVAGGK